MSATGSNIMDANSKESTETCVLSALRALTSSIDTKTSSADTDLGFFVADLGVVIRQHLRWLKYLPRAEPFYAVKCNDDPAVLRLLAKLGCGFDCASKGEIDKIFEETAINPDKIIYAHPCKPIGSLRYAAARKIRKMTFDGADELQKIKSYAPEAELFLRIKADDSASASKFSEKFGSENPTTLLALAKELNLRVVGISFHVGSGATDPLTFEKSLRDAQIIFKDAANLGFNLHTLDIGGGFTNANFEKSTEILNPLLDECFPATRIIAEPGRFYVASAFTLACHVIARQHVKDDVYKLFINDGVYSNFLTFLIDKLPDPVPKALSSAEEIPGSSEELCERAPKKTKEYSIWGQTADGVDRVAENWQSSQLIHIGDWLYFEEMGAYTLPSETRFNGFSDRSMKKYICTEPVAMMDIGT